MISMVFGYCAIDFKKDNFDKNSLLDDLTHPHEKEYFSNGENKARFRIDKYPSTGTIHINSNYDHVEEHYSPDEWLVDFVFENYQKFLLWNVEKIGFTFTYLWIDECKIKLSTGTMGKIAQMNAYLCVSCENGND